MSKTSTRNILRPTVLALAAAACASAIAQDNAQTLSEVVVSATGFEQELKQAPASITVVTREELERKSVRDLAQALHGVEGIDVLGGTGKTGGYNISMRGMPSQYTLILIDGQRTGSAGETTPNGFGDSQNVMMPPVSAIERIEVIRGPMSTLYGSDAMGGVINIITRKVAKEWAGSVSLEGSLPQTQGEGASQKSNFYLTGPIKEDLLGIAVRGGWTHRDGYDGKPLGFSGNNTSGYLPTKSDVYNLGAKLTLTPTTGQQFWLNVESQRSQYDNRSSNMGTLDTPSKASGYGPELQFNRDQIGIGYEGRTQLGLLSTSLSYRTHETLGRTIAGDNTSTKPFGGPRILDSESTLLDAKLVSSINDQHLLTSGAQLALDETRDGFSIDAGKPKFSRTTWALFAEDEWRIRPDLTFTTGLRYDHHDKFGGHLNPRGYVVWNTSDKWTVKGGISRGFAAPSLNRLSEGLASMSGQGTTRVIGNPSLQPETSTSTELGAMFDNLQGWTSSATLFHNKIKNKIEQANCTGVNTPLPGCERHTSTNGNNYYYNANSGTTYGAEFSNKLALKHGVDLKVSYTWTESQLIDNKGIKAGRFSDTAKHLLLANTNWKINHQWSTWLQAEYRSGARRTSAVATQDQMFNAYSLFHAGVNFAYTSKVNVGLSVNNLFNRDFRAKDSNGQALYYVSGGPNAKGATQDGRTLWLRTTVQF